MKTKNQHNSQLATHQILQTISLYMIRISNICPATEFLGPRGVEVLHVRGLRPHGLRRLRTAGDAHGGRHQHRTPRGHGRDAGRDGAGHVARGTWETMEPGDKWRSSGTFHGETRSLQDVAWFFGIRDDEATVWSRLGPTIKTLPCWEVKWWLSANRLTIGLFGVPILRTNPHPHWRTMGEKCGKRETQQSMDCYTGL